MPKKLDILHYILTALLLGSIFYYNYPFTEGSTVNKGIDKYSFLLAKYTADSLVIAEQYDEALLKFIEIDSQYQHQINLEAVTAIINNKRAEHETFLAIQTLDSSSDTDRKESSTSTKKTVPSKKKETTINTSIDSSIKNNSLPTHQVTDIVKGVLQITNFDGAEIDYIGEVKNNKAHGFGFAVFEKRGFYEGQWTNNRRNGEGVYYWQNGDVYEGHYLNGLRTGYGVYTFASGEIYKGYWKDNLRHGEGILYNKRGKIVSNGSWVKDEVVMKKRTKKKK